MRVTITAGGTVTIDGVTFVVDISDLPSAFHALQWDGMRGEVEYSMTSCDHCGARTKKGNEIISDLAPYQKYVDGWRAAKVTAEAAAKAAEEARTKAIADAAEAARVTEEAANAARSEG